MTLAVTLTKSNASDDDDSDRRVRRTVILVADLVKVKKPTRYYTCVLGLDNSNPDSADCKWKRFEIDLKCIAFALAYNGICIYKDSSSTTIYDSD